MAMGPRPARNLKVVVPKKSNQMRIRPMNMSSKLDRPSESGRPRYQMELNRLQLHQNHKGYQAAITWLRVYFVSGEVRDGTVNTDSSGLNVRTAVVLGFASIVRCGISAKNVVVQAFVCTNAGGANAEIVVAPAFVNMAGVATNAKNAEVLEFASTAESAQNARTVEVPGSAHIIV